MQRFWSAALLGAAFVLLPQVVVAHPNHEHTNQSDEDFPLLLNSADATIFSFSTPLSGAQEVPPNNSLATGFATAILKGNPTNWLFEYTVTFSDLSGPLVLGHIHQGAIDVAGPVVHNLDSLPLGVTSGTIVGNWSSTEVTDTVATFNGLLTGNFYFNLHSDTAEFRRPGEIRGQIDEPVTKSVPEPASALSLLIFGLLGGGLQLRNQKNRHQSTIAKC